MPIRHYVKAIRTIAKSSYPYSRFMLLNTYLRLLAKSIIYHKLGTPKATSPVPCYKANILGYPVCFQNFGDLINQFEEIFINSIYDGGVLKKDCPLIIDCGSNIGLSILYFKLRYPDSKIIGFEPHPDTFELLRHNIDEQNLTNVDFFKIALSDTTGVKTLHSRFDSTLNNSLLEPQVNDNTSSYQVETALLSNYVNAEVSLLKLDVEGMESFIIHDLIDNRTISLIKQMIVEDHFINSTRITELLLTQNFKLSSSISVERSNDQILTFRSLS